MGPQSLGASASGTFGYFAVASQNDVVPRLEGHCDGDYSHSLPVPMNILHVGEGNLLVVLAGIFEVESGAGQEDKIAIEVFGDGRRIGRGETIDNLAVRR